MNDLRTLVDDAAPERAPGFDTVLARRDQRARRRRGALAGVSTAVLVAATTFAVHLGASDRDQGPAPAPIQTPTQSVSPTPTQLDRADPTYTWSDEPSRVVLRLPERDVPLTTWLGCWWGPTGNLDCVEDEPQPVADLPDIGSPEAVEFWFGVKGWTFEASFTELGGACPRSEDTVTTPKGAHWFRLEPAGFAGDYRVSLEGYGPHAGFKGVPTMMSFVWHTPVDGPVDQPKATVSDSDLEVSALGLTPVSAEARVTITDATGETTTRTLPSGGGECSGGALYFQGDFDDPAIPELGPGPYRYRVLLTLDGTTYVGTGADTADAGTSADLVWSPPLPALTR
ncbi:conserved hypothetical protein [metagenome]|uniref:Uncharacterized protein n=1 Tax=metagenome TaxID=256318 RepID=A0A2P2BYY3_9ZZZZ